MAWNTRQSGKTQRQRQTGQYLNFSWSGKAPNTLRKLPEVPDKINLRRFEVIKRWIITTSTLEHRQTTVQPFWILNSRQMLWWSVAPASPSVKKWRPVFRLLHTICRVVLSLSIAASVPAHTYPKRRSFKSDFNLERRRLKNKRPWRWSVRSTNLRYWDNTSFSRCFSISAS